MTILNSTCLQAVELITPDKKTPLLNNVHITHNGSVITSNSQAVMGVQSPALKQKATAEDINADTIKEVLKAMPKSSKYKDLIDIVEMQRDGNKVFFTFNDGLRQRSIEAKTYTHGYIDYKTLIKRNLDFEGSPSVCISQKRLLTALRTFEKIRPDSSAVHPVFMHITDEALTLRIQVQHTDPNGKTITQHVFCVLRQDRVPQWLELNEWEKGFINKPILSRKKILKRG